MLFSRDRAANCAVCFLLTATSCATETPPAEAETPEGEMCEHLAEGPAQIVAASSADTAAALPEVSKSHTRFDVDLPKDASGTYTGYVRFAAPAKGAYLLGMNAKVPVEVALAASGTAVAPAVAVKPACAVALYQAELALELGTYRVKLGPAHSAKVGLLFEAK
ncbi:MAG: hypothetical protein EXR77_16250 [Myxococcales bacterium]|nr:hypothetical protein [Myxococcales bacterium]